MSKRVHKAVTICVLVFLSVSLCGGCEGLKYHNIYMAAAAGAVVGAIVGHQSDECAAGAGVGAAVFAVGELLRQIDNLNERKLKDAADEVAQGNSMLDLSRSE